MKQFREETSPGAVPSHGLHELPNSLVATFKTLRFSVDGCVAILVKATSAIGTEQKRDGVLKAHTATSLQSE